MAEEIRPDLILILARPPGSILIDLRADKKTKVPPRFELGLQDSESWVLTITPWDHSAHQLILGWFFKVLVSETIYFTVLSHLHISVAVVAEWLRRLTRNQLRSPCTGSNPVNCASFFHSFHFFLMRRRKNVFTPGGTRTHNPWLRRPMPYPLGHGGT